ncbi:MAG: hypothetical protein LBD16_03575 [Oscillospiraceae bacterium]|jgi:hypothetical protein|nr:hypothetical protein [Oscillospiraceae bacterium]
MNVINERVSHRKFGEGTIVKHDDSLITVNFDVKDGEMKFVYPYGFETFLEFVNPDTQRGIISEIRRIRDRLELEQRMLAEENEKRGEHQQKLLLEQKKDAQKKSAAARKAAAKPAAKRIPIVKQGI